MAYKAKVGDVVVGTDFNDGWGTRPVFADDMIGIVAEVRRGCVYPYLVEVEIGGLMLPLHGTEFVVIGTLINEEDEA